MPITSQLVYGYLKGSDGHFIVDPEAAPKVKQIFSLCLAGNGPTKIARNADQAEHPHAGDDGVPAHRQHPPLLAGLPL